MKSRTNLEVIKVLRSDNAKEYFSSALSSFLSSQGVLHQSTCPHTPQQNGITERKNRHLVETAGTLLLNANIPVHYWGYAVLNTNFLINGIPYSTLDNKIPLSVISPNEPLYHLSPRVFGCTCFVHDVSLRLDKLSERTIKCVFLGYPIFRKGIHVIFQTLRGYTCLLMLPSSKKPLSSHLPCKIPILYNRYYVSHPSIQ